MNNYKYQVYNPCWQTVNCAKDWGFAPDQTTTDLAISQAQPYRIIALRPFYNCTWIFDHDPAVCDFAPATFDLVLISDPEYYSQQEIQEWCAQNNISQYLIALGGHNEKNNIDCNKMLYRNFYVEHFINSNTFVDTHSNSKPYLFDALLGARRPNRDYVMLGLAQNNLLDKSIVTYRDCFVGHVIDHQNQEFADIFNNTKLMYPYVSPHLESAWEVADVVTNQISFIVPERVYQRTYYSILTETLYTGGAFFMSEKSIKAMFAKRIFVLFGNQYHLKRLQQLGFKTFGDVIDESYDDCPLDFERFALAMQQVINLSKQDPVQVQLKLQSVLDHNHTRLLVLPREARSHMHNLTKSNTPAAAWSR